MYNPLHMNFRGRDTDGCFVDFAQEVCAVQYVPNAAGTEPRVTDKMAVSHVFEVEFVDNVFSCGDDIFYFCHVWSHVSEGFIAMAEG
jgi:hypothetical protein